MRLLLSLLVTFAAFAQVKIANPGFEDGELGATPTGWFMPPAVAQAGFTATLVEQGCRTGARCTMMTGTATASANAFGNLMQSIGAGGHTMRRIRFRAAIRVEGYQTRAQMWLRIDRADGTMAFLENMSRSPITSAEWKTYDIEVNVPADAARLNFGFMLMGAGKAWIDDASLEITNEIHPDKTEAARPLSAQGLTNLIAFAGLYGYVRHFHPSDQAAATDWETFAVEGVRQVEDAGSTAELAERLRKLFQPIAPTVLLFVSGDRPQPAAFNGPEMVRYKHRGVGLPTTTVPANIYNSVRERKPAGEMAKPFEAELIPGLTAVVPLSLYADSGGTLPHQPVQDASPLYNRSAEDRGTRLADVVIAWNVFQHFYPYFDVVKTDWRGELPKALRSAATDSGSSDFHKTLQRLVAALKDGHGRVAFRGGEVPVPPLTFDWVENQFLVTRVQAGKSEGIKPGDRVLKIDDQPVEQANAAARELISGATEQWIRYRSVAALSACNLSTRRMKLEIEPFADPGTSKSVEVACGPPKFRDRETYTEPRPDKIAELEPEVFYVDLDRVNDADWKGLVTRLEKAKGIIFDMRGYPGQPGIQSLAHLTDSTIRSAKWNVSSAAMPDRLDSPFQESGWDVQPRKPYFTAPRVFLTDGRAISYAETVMGIVEHFKLGEIVGEPTAGTNGNVNPFTLPGGFTISWTGMKVLKHDGSQHHGIGILPTVPASRTRKGVAEEKDEILLRSLEVVKAKAK